MCEDALKVALKLTLGVCVCVCVEKLRSSKLTCEQCSLPSLHSDIYLVILFTFLMETHIAVT